MKIDNRIEFNIISKNRSTLMGLAIILIMLCHNSVTLPFPGDYINSIVKTMAQCGVDLFMLLSGFGCVYSLSKNANVFVFLKKRCRRIMPSYCIVMFFCFIWEVIIIKCGIKNYIYNYCLITFFTHGVLIEWFVASILLLYILVPLLYNLMNRNLQVFLGIIVGLYILILIYYYWGINGFESLNVIVSILLTRVPSFMVGMILADCSMKQLSCSSIWGTVLGICSTIAVIISVLAIYVKCPTYLVICRVLFLPIVLELICFYDWLATKNLSCNKTIAKFLSWISIFTLEIYLVHEKILSVLNQYVGKLPNTSINCIVSLCINFISMLLSVIVASYIYKFSRRFNPLEMVNNEKK